MNKELIGLYHYPAELMGGSDPDPEPRTQSICPEGEKCLICGKPILLGQDVFIRDEGCTHKDCFRIDYKG